MNNSTAPFDTKPTEQNNNHDFLEKYIVLGVQGTKYGIKVSKVIEVVHNQKFTGIPETPNYVKGIINLRNNVISVIDLKLRFNMGEVEESQTACIVIIEKENKNGDIIPIGILVEEVFGVMRISREDVEQANLGVLPKVHDYLSGIAKHSTGDILLLNSEHLLDFSLLDNISTFSKSMDCKVQAE